MRKTILALAAGAAAFAGAGAHAAVMFGVSGEAWKGADNTVFNEAAARNLVSSRAADATFDVTAIDYPNGDSTDTAGPATTLAELLGIDGASLVGTNFDPLTDTVLLFTGQILLRPGDLWSIGSDDGYDFSVGGTTIAEAPIQGFTTQGGAFALGAGVYDFELLFFNRGGPLGIEFKLDGDIAVDQAVPLPGAALLMGSGLVGLAIRRRRKNG